MKAYILRITALYKTTLMFTLQTFSSVFIFETTLPLLTASPKTFKMMFFAREWYRTLSANNITHYFWNFYNVSSTLHLASNIIIKSSSIYNFFLLQSWRRWYCGPELIFKFCHLRCLFLQVNVQVLCSFVHAHWSKNQSGVWVWQDFQWSGYTYLH